MLEFVTMGYMVPDDNFEEVSEDEWVDGEEAKTSKNSFIDFNGYNKRRCEELKSMRKKLVREFDIDMEIAECTSKGPCTELCDACEAEALKLDRLIREKQAREDNK